jgi:hypothetical protein
LEELSRKRSLPFLRTSMMRRTSGNGRDCAGRCIGAAAVVLPALRRLRDDFELDRNGMVLALTLMQRIDALNEELDALRARIVHEQKFDPYQPMMASPGIG